MEDLKQSVARLEANVTRLVVGQDEIKQQLHNLAASIAELAGGGAAQPPPSASLGGALTGAPFGSGPLRTSARLTHQGSLSRRIMGRQTLQADAAAAVAGAGVVAAPAAVSAQGVVPLGRPAPGQSSSPGSHLHQLFTLAVARPDLFKKAEQEFATLGSAGSPHGNPSPQRSSLGISGPSQQQQAKAQVLVVEHPPEKPAPGETRQRAMLHFEDGEADGGHKTPDAMAAALAAARGSAGGVSETGAPAKSSRSKNKGVAWASDGGDAEVTTSLQSRTDRGKSVTMQGTNMVTVLEDDASDGEGSEHGRGKAKRKQAKQQENNQDAHQGDGVDDPNAVGLAVASQLMVRRGPDPDLPWFISYPKYVIWDVLDHPEPLRTWWLLLMITLMVYVISVTPYLIAFEVATIDLTKPISVIDLCVSILFFCDIWVNMRTSYLDNHGRFVRDRWRIFKDYVKYWFWIDAASAIPWDIVLGSHFGLLRLLRVSKTQRLMKILSVVRVLRMLRVLHAKSVVQQLEELLGRYVSRMIFFSGLALTLVHWSACAFYFMAMLHDFDEGTWIYAQFGDQNESRTPNLKRYIAAIYWAFTTMATVGYGDITARSIIERICAICVMVVGASMFAYLIGSVASLLADMNYTQAKINRKLTIVEAFLAHRRVPGVLAKKVRSYYHYVAHQEVLDDEADILAGLSHSLRSQIILHMYKGVLEKVEFFRGKHSRFITAVCQLLRPEFYAPGDVVIFQGDVAMEMYFVIQGLLEARVYDSDSLARLRHTEGMDAGQAHAKPSMRPPSPLLDDEGDILYNDHDEEAVAPKVARSAISIAVVKNPKRASAAVAAVRQEATGKAPPTRVSDPGSQRGGPSNRGSSGGGGPAGLAGAFGNSKVAPEPGGHSLAEGPPVAKDAHGSTSSRRGSTNSVSLQQRFKSFIGQAPKIEEEPYIYDVVGVLMSGTHFGETTGLLGLPRAVTVVAVDHSELYSLARSDLQQVLALWPALKEELDRLCESYLEQIAGEEALGGMPLPGGGEDGGDGGPGAGLHGPGSMTHGQVGSQSGAGWGSTGGNASQRAGSGSVHGPGLSSGQKLVGDANFFFAATRASTFKHRTPTVQEESEEEAGEDEGVAGYTDARGEDEGSTGEEGGAGAGGSRRGRGAKRESSGLGRNLKDRDSVSASGGSATGSAPRLGPDSQHGSEPSSPGHALRAGRVDVLASNPLEPDSPKSLLQSNSGSQHNLGRRHTGQLDTVGTGAGPSTLAPRLTNQMAGVGMGGSMGGGL